MRRICSLLAGVPLLALGASAGPLPASIAPGDGAVSGARIVPYDNAWSVTTRRADGALIHDGVATDHVAIVTEAGRRLLLRVEGQVDDDGSLSDTSISRSDAATLAPVAYEDHAVDGSVERRRYDGTHLFVAAIRAPGAPEAVAQFDLPQPVFDFRGNMTGLLLRAQPLAQGYAARVPWADGDGKLHLTEINVLRRETIEAGFKGRLDTWVVAVGAAPSHVTYWIADVAPYVIKVVIESPDAVTSWEMTR